MELRRASTQNSGPAAVFLPGIILPAEMRYGPLIHELGSSFNAFTKDLEVYEPGRQGGEFSIETEVEGLTHAADRASVEHFYLYGHSGGGAVALAFAATYPNRLLGLAVDEPASDFSAANKASWEPYLAPIRSLPEAERLPAFLRVQVAPGVELPSPPPGPPPDWMATRPAGVSTFSLALDRYVLPAPLSNFRGPVYYSFGSLTNPSWRQMRDRLAETFPNFSSEEYESLHHLNTSHAAQPARVATALKRVWSI